MSEKDRWPLTLSIIADRATEILGDRVKHVYMALSEAEARSKATSFPSLGVIKISYSAEEQPEESFIRSKGTATVGFILRTQENKNTKDALEGEEILGLLRREHPLGLIGFAPKPFEDEGAFPMWLQEEVLEEVSGGRITLTAAYALEIWMTHTEA